MIVMAFIEDRLVLLPHVAASNLAQRILQAYLVLARHRHRRPS